MLALLANPDVAVLTLLAGILLIYYEINRPGTILPGAAGVLLAGLGVFGITRHPLDTASCLVLLPGLGILIWPAGRHGNALLQAAVGTGFILYGLAHLFATPPALHRSVALAAALIFGISSSWLLTIAAAARRNKAPGQDFFPDRRSSQAPGTR